MEAPNGAWSTGKPFPNPGIPSSCCLESQPGVHTWHLRSRHGKYPEYPTGKIPNPGGRGNLGAAPSKPQTLDVPRGDPEGIGNGIGNGDWAVGGDRGPGLPGQFWGGGARSVSPSLSARSPSGARQGPSASRSPPGPAGPAGPQSPRVAGGASARSCPVPPGPRRARGVAPAPPGTSGPAGAAPRPPPPPPPGPAPPAAGTPPPPIGQTRHQAPPSHALIGWKRDTERCYCIVKLSITRLNPPTERRS